MQRPVRPIAVSTLGAPGVDLPEVLAVIAAGGGTAIELRVGQGEPVSVPSNAAVHRRVRRQIDASGLNLLTIASYVRVGAAGPDEQVIGDLVDHLRLAADLGAPYLRVFPGAPRMTKRNQLSPLTTTADRVMAHRLAAAVPLAQSLAVRPVMETHDSHPRGADVARVLHRLDAMAPGHPVGAIWDVLHPLTSGEAPQQTWTAVRSRILDGAGYIQVKDAASSADPTPVPIGDGYVPLAEILTILDDARYTGPLSLEWERAWYPDIPELAVALRSLQDWLRGWGRTR